MINISIRNSYKLQIRPNEDITRTLKAKQGDTVTRFLDITALDDDGTPYDLTGCEIWFSVRKPSGLSIFNKGEITDAESGEITVELDNQILAEAGTLRAEVSINGPDGEQILTTREFVIDIQATLRDENAITTSNEFTVLTEALYDVREFKAVTQDISDRIGYPDDGVSEGLEQAGDTTFQALNKFYTLLLENSVVLIGEAIDEVRNVLYKNIPKPGKKIFINDGTFTVPDGVGELIITACGGGGSGTVSTQANGNNGTSTIIGSLITLPGGGGGGTNSAGVAGGIGGGNGGSNGGPGSHGIAGLGGEGAMGAGGSSGYNTAGGGGSLGGGGAGGGGNGDWGCCGGASLYSPGFSSQAISAGRGGFGGGSGSANFNNGGGGGGAAAIIEQEFAVTPGQNISITMGKGGAKAGARGGSGGDGIVIIEWLNREA